MTQPYVQCDLDELEFLRGDASTTYGTECNQLVFPAPLQINYVEVGKEDNLNNLSDRYSAYRFPAFYDALHAAYLDITIIGSTVGNQPLPGTAFGDYHQYTNPDYFITQFNFFDNYTSQHPTSMYFQPATVNKRILRIRT